MLANEESDKPLGKQDYIGWALWATGMFFEVVADMQKTAFKNDPKNQVLLNIIRLALVSDFPLSLSFKG